MLDELLSGMIGSSIAEWAQKRWPRRATLRSALPFDELQTRYRALYWSTGVSGGVTFALIFAYMLAGGWRGQIWQLEVWFGAPFSLMTTIPLVWCLFGRRARVREFLRYWELKQKLNLWILVSCFAPLTLLGVFGIFSGFIAQ